MKRKARQQEFGFTNHGGKRKGAGRKPKGAKAGVAHERRVRFKPYQPLMVTLRLCEGLRSLRADREHALLLEAFQRSEREDFRVVHYSVQSNHLHLVVEAQGHEALSRGMIGLSVRIARVLNRLWRRKGKVLGDRYHAEVLKNPTMVRNALVYVLNNGRKHGCWIAARPDVYSSGPWFDGWRRPPIEAESSPRPLPRPLPPPKTWLLSVGWKRLGLLAVHDLPKLQLPKSKRSRLP